jgi:hypothetical protein
MLPEAVYFHIENDVVYEDGFAYLAEGLADLGVECCGSRDFWVRHGSNAPLVRGQEIASRKWPVVFISNNTYRHESIDADGRHLIRHNDPDLESLSKQAERIVLIDLQDGYSNIGAEDPRISLIFRAKFNRWCRQSPKTRPYVLGVQKRVLDYPPRTSEDPWNERRILDSTGFTHPYQHGTRRYFDQKLIPILEDMGIRISKEMAGKIGVEPNDADARQWWLLTDGKHNTEYFDLVRRFPMHACFCGEIISALPTDPTSILLGGRRAQLRKIFWSFLSGFCMRPRRLIQWDSWRFWETLALGATPLMFDLAKLGVVLPVMPENWVHYVGLDLEDPFGSIRELENRWHDIPQIAAAGRSWLIDHYSPVANARRVCHEVGLSTGI